MKKKRTYTRRQRAIRWLTALLIVLLVGHGTNTYHLIPSHAIDNVAQMNVLEDLEVVHSQWGKHSPMVGKRLYISQNEGQILVSATAFHPMIGWYYFGPGIVIDRGDPESYHTSWSIAKDEKVCVCLAGFVPEGEAPPTYSLGLVDTSKPVTNGAFHVPDDPITVTPVADIPVEGGSVYLEMHSLPPREKGLYLSVLLNENGQLSEVKNRCSTSVG